MKKPVKIIARVAAGLSGCVLALLTLVLLGLQTPPAKRAIVRVAETQAGKMLHGGLHVGRLTGNWLSRLAVEDVSLVSPEGDTVAYIGRVALRYDLWPLLHGAIAVHEVSIDRPSLHLYQLPDSSWNVAHLLKPAPAGPDTTSSSFDMTVRLGRLALADGQARIDALDPLIPRRVDSLFIALSGSYAAREQSLDLTDFRLRTRQPEMQLRSLRVRAEADTAGVRVDTLSLRTAQNGVTVQGVYGLTRGGRSHLTLETLPLHLGEFAPFLPGETPLRVAPTLRMDASLQADTLRADLSVSEGGEALHAAVAVQGLPAYLADSALADPHYTLALRLQGLDLRRWVSALSADYRLNGVLQAEGRGFDPHTLQASVRGDFDGLRIDGRPVDRLQMGVRYDAGDVEGEVATSGDFGELHFVPQVRRLFGGRPQYDVHLTTRRLNAAPLLADTAYTSSLNLTASLRGSGFDPAALTAQGAVSVQPSSVSGFRIDTLRADVAFADRNVQLRQLWLQALSARVSARGNYALAGHSELHLEASADSMQAIAPLVGLQGFDTRAALSIHAEGMPDSLRAALEATATGTRYDSWTLDTLQVGAQAQVVRGGVEGVARLQAAGLAGAGLSLEGAGLEVTTDLHRYEVSLHAEGTDMDARLRALVQLGDAIRVSLSGLEAAYKDYRWQQVSDTARVRIAPLEYEVRDLHLASTGGLAEQSLRVDGVVSRTDSQSLRVEIDRIDVPRILSLLGTEAPLTGLASARLQLSGTAFAPRLVGTVWADSVSVQGLRLDTVQARVGLADGAARLDLAVVPAALGSIHAGGCVPAEVRLDSMTFRVVPAPADSLRARLSIDRIPLSLLHGFIDADEIRGELNSRVEVGGTVGQPVLSGAVRVDSGAVKIPQYGIDYRDIVAGIRATRDEVRIDTFRVASPDGDMMAGGAVRFRSELYRADLDSSRMTVAFHRFNPFRHKQFRMEMSGEVGVTANADSTVFAGDITIPEANIYLPAVLALMGKFSTPTMPQPLLAAELERALHEGDSLVYTFRPDTAATDTARRTLAFLDNLQGSVKVGIPRNTWIRNEDMRLELSGDVQLMKHRDFFEVFGTIDVVRGQYNLLGKVFVIESGTVSFQGGEKISPILNIDATYAFRDAYRNKRELGITVTGGMDNLVIKFDLGGDEIGEGDALSYIIFGRALNELSTTEASGIDAGELAGKAAASLISSQLTKLGNTFNVDYIEVDVGSSFDNASFTVGKYITNKLFVSYEQRIGTLEDDDIARYEMTLEYELFKFLFLQLTSSPITNGFDLIFKVDADTFSPRGKVK